MNTNNLFDQNQLEKLQKLAGDRFGAVVSSFENDINRMLPGLRKAVADNSLEDIHGMAHALKNVSSNLAASRMSALCKELELQARNGNIEDVETRVKKIEDESYRVINRLRQIV